MERDHRKSSELASIADELETEANYDCLKRVVGAVTATSWYTRRVSDVVVHILPFIPYEGRGATHDRYLASYHQRVVVLVSEHLHNLSVCLPSLLL